MGEKEAKKEETKEKEAKREETEEKMESGDKEEKKDETKSDEKKDDKEVSKESDDKDPKKAVEALNLLAQGKRNMLCGEVPQAVQQLQEACRLLAANYGDTADECGEAYLSYGTALLDLSRMESGV